MQCAAFPFGAAAQEWKVGCEKGQRGLVMDGGWMDAGLPPLQSFSSWKWRGAHGLQGLTSHVPRGLHWASSRLYLLKHVQVFQATAQGG